MKHLICGEVVGLYCGKFTAYGTGMDWVIRSGDGCLMRGRIPQNCRNQIDRTGQRVAFYARLHPEPNGTTGCRYYWRRPTPAISPPDKPEPLELMS